MSPGPGLSPAHRAELKPKALVPSWKPCSFCPRGLVPHLCSCLLPAPRLTGLEESAWGDEEDPEHNYYNSIPGKEPPVGGLVDSRLALTQPCALWALGQVSRQGPRGGGALGGGNLRQGGPGADSQILFLPFLLLLFFWLQGRVSCACPLLPSDLLGPVLDLQMWRPPLDTE